MNQNYLLSALVADSLALAAHWIYDPVKLESIHGRVQAPKKPSDDSYHQGQPKGGQTHLGHQVIVLSEALSKKTPFSEELRKFWSTSSSYKDHATKNFLAQNAERSGELAGASRLAAVVAHHDSYESAAMVMKEQTLVTHSENVAEAGDKLLQLFYLLKAGQNVSSAVTSVFGASPSYQKAKAVENLPTVQAISKLGQDCSLESSLPSVLYLLLRAEDYRETMIDNVMAGGDSASRGLVLGPLLVAHFGFESVPKEWLSSLEYQLSPVS